jgi:hypothetical protein
MYYLTDEDYALAEANGIPKKNVYARYYMDGWNRERAITEPILKRNPIWPQYRDLCKKNGIAHRTFFARVQKGMDYERAATMPPTPKGQHLRNRPKKILPEHYKMYGFNIGIWSELLVILMFQNHGGGKQSNEHYISETRRAVTKPRKNHSRRIVSNR